MGKVASHIWTFSGPKGWKKKINIIGSSDNFTFQDLACKNGKEPQLLEAVGKLEEKEQGNFRDAVHHCSKLSEKKHREELQNKRPKTNPEVEGSTEMPGASGKPSLSTPVGAPAEVAASAANDTISTSSG